MNTKSLAEKIVEALKTECGLVVGVQWSIKPEQVIQSVIEAHQKEQGGVNASLRESSVLCMWTENINGAFETSCNHIFEFTNDGVKENGFKHCPWCGRPMLEASSPPKDSPAMLTEEDRNTLKSVVGFLCLVDRENLNDTEAGIVVDTLRRILSSMTPRKGQNDQAHPQPGAAVVERNQNNQ